MIEHVGVIDYGAGNVTNVSRALDFLGVNNELVSSPEKWGRFSALILPGVGSFVYGMEELRERRLTSAIIEATEFGTPLLGICLGMQLLFDFSEEGGGAEGLGLIPGVVRQLEPSPGESEIRVPHVGWSRIASVATDAVLPQGGGAFYFSHSFAADGVPEDIVTSHGFLGSRRFVASVASKRLTGLQFHPEKSSHTGLGVLKGWVQSCR